MATTTLLERNPVQMGLSVISRGARSADAPMAHQRRPAASVTKASEAAPQATPIQKRLAGGGGGEGSTAGGMYGSTKGR